MDDVILVDESDRELGTMGKLEAHRKGSLHRAFSVFIFHPDGRMLLQRRAPVKYHSGGLWSNACCGHPRPGESVLSSAHRRLVEEMGFSCDLRELYAFRYRTSFENGLKEHEYDHVLIGTSDCTPKPDLEEVDDWEWKGVEEVRAAIASTPERYTYWFKTAFEDVLERR